MLKKSKKLGKNISNKAEVQNISDRGIWILVSGRELFLSFSEFHWFLNATIEQIYNLQFLHEKHLHWPELDIDIELESLEHPTSYPLKYT